MKKRWAVSGNLATSGGLGGVEAKIRLFTSTPPRSLN